MGRKICFVGFAASSREWANEVPEDWEIWGTNECHLFLTRELRPEHDRWFQIHPRDWEVEKVKKHGFVPNGFGRPYYHQHWLSQQSIPVYTQVKDDLIPTSIPYPFEKVAELSRPLFLTSTLAYMMALAVVEQRERGDIEAYTWAGIELQLTTEYFFQQACFYYWAGQLEGLGVERITPEPPYTTQLFAEPVYAKASKAPMQPMTMRELLGRR